MLESNSMPQSYNPPPLNLLNEKSSVINDQGFFLESIFKQYGVGIRVTGVFNGPCVTHYEIKPEPGVRLAEVYELNADLEYCLAVGPIRIVRATPMVPVITIEVPNKKRRNFYLRDYIEADKTFSESSNMEVCIGVDTKGRVITSGINVWNHLLIGGYTGSGKTTFINSLLINSIYKFSPDDIQFILFDPNVHDLTIYDGIPHMPMNAIIYPESAVEMLNWAVYEMDRRYRLFAESCVRDIESYNSKVENNDYSIETIELLDVPEDKESQINTHKLPRLIIIINELADLMMVAPNAAEKAICKLAQLSSATGIHLIISTQRPAKDVITNTIKANIQNRIAFAVSDSYDSKRILGVSGAEELLSKGDMLYYPLGEVEPKRLLGAYVSEEEVYNISNYLRNSYSSITYKNPLNDNKEFNVLKSKINEDDHSAFWKAYERRLKEC